MVARCQEEASMSLFQCCKCGCAEDTTLCHYWSARVRDVRPMCSACDPNIGKWHGEFARVSEHIWLASFMDYDLGYFDDETCTARPLAGRSQRPVFASRVTLSDLRAGECVLSHAVD